ncbi:hypothetical protein L1987_00188 [Smallanthus sonchifolius]|uniref:Uncharacterized protein n=1 Tax=Smallanthus sonchifolius TaxID=185202 RepID=A0ACB9K1M1_9ASTR|nr:hypothetical protein L1987_00188 [Smallanthus sonchifolius]
MKAMLYRISPIRTMETQLDESDAVPDLSNSHNGSSGEKVERPNVLEKCNKQIEKDLLGIFPGHPALNEEGRNTLRRA